ncbi:AAA family ATPase (plasmid) [Rhizobium beringeri]|nr:AAA family ATPase [Rhizobium beringeri]WSH17391.1 AAA family ATPase [Rhizobium beringeri]
MPPSALGGSLAIAGRHSFLQYLQLDPTKREQTRVPIMEFDSQEILRALSHVFFGKCAFCEQASKSMYVHRFRPTNDADPTIGGEEDGRSRDAHLYYGWLSDAWINLYPICGECRPKRTNYFPVSGQRMPVPSAEQYTRFVEKGDGTWPDLELDEIALLLDPCGSDDIVRHLVPLDDGSLQAATPSGEETIKHFSLNRPRLKKKRQQAFTDYAKLRGSGPNDTNEFIGLWRILSRQTAVSEAEQSSITASANIVEEDDTAARPRLTEIRLTNFKAIESLSIKLPAAPDPSERLAQALLILGENAAGKSSILEAVALALIQPDARPDLVSKPDGLRLDPSFMGAPEVKKKASARVRLLYDGKRESTLTIRGSGFSQTGLNQLPFVFGYGAYRHYLSDLHPWKPSRPVISLFHSESLLTNPEEWLLGLSLTEFRSVMQALGAIFGAAEEVDVIYRDPAAKRCFVEMQIDASGKKSRTPLSNVSSGFRTILALSCDIMRWLMDRSVNPGFVSLISAEGIVLIDEVEAHLHPRWKIQIMKGLRTALPAMTFIVTTHDPLCLRGMRDGEVVVLSKIVDQRPGSQIPVMVDGLTALPKVATLTIEQLLTSDLFSLFSTDDPKTEESLARLGDYLAKNDGSAPAKEVKKAMDAIHRQILEELPVGTSEVARLVQEAVSIYLVKRRNLPTQKRNALRKATRDRILAALETI